MTKKTFRVSVTTWHPNRHCHGDAHGDEDMVIDMDMVMDIVRGRAMTMLPDHGMSRRTVTVRCMWYGWVRLAGVNGGCGAGASCMSQCGVSGAVL